MHTYLTCKIRSQRALRESSFGFSGFNTTFTIQIKLAKAG